MNIYETERRVLRMLAALKGGHLNLDGYDLNLGKKLEGTEHPLSEREFKVVVKALEEKGLVASILERLDGHLIALTAEGRQLMEAEGIAFDTEQVGKTRALFLEWRCRASI
jgi:hypothetical protein